MLYKLSYFKKSRSGICANDFKNKKEVDTININFLLSLSGLQRFEMPLSVKYVEDFAIVTMSNNDTYYIDKTSFEDLSKALAVPAAGN